MKLRTEPKKETFEKELVTLSDLVHIEKQERNGEIRYALYFVYSGKKGRVYVLTFKEKIRVITIYPLGRKTLSKYKKKGLYIKNE